MCLRKICEKTIILTIAFTALLYISLLAEYSEVASLTELCLPQNVVIENSIVAWDKVDNAVAYRLYVNGVAVTDIIEELYYDISTIILPMPTDRQVHESVLFQIFAGLGEITINLPATVGTVNLQNIILNEVAYSNVPLIIQQGGVYRIQLRAIADNENFKDSVLGEESYIYAEAQKFSSPIDTKRLELSAEFMQSNFIQTIISAGDDLVVNFDVADEVGFFSLADNTRVGGMKCFN